MYRIYYLLIIIFINSAILAQGIIKTVTNNLELGKQFNSVLTNSNEDVLIGYSITNKTDNIISIGTFYIDKNNNGFCLREIIDNPKKYNVHFAKHSKNKMPYLKGHKFRIIINSNKNNTKPDSETAIIFHYSKGETNINNFNDVIVCNMALDVELAPDKLYWLGKIENKKSIDYLSNIYKSASSFQRKKGLIPAIGMHKNQLQTTQFLIDVSNDKQNPKLREESFYWLGYQDNINALNTLKKIIHSNEYNEIRKDALVGLAQMNITDGIDELISIAKQSKETDIRKEAIMYLGEKAVKKASEELKGFIENDPEIEIKKQALFALAEQSRDNLPYIINLARSHQSLTIRKNAIYILGECDDKQAVEVLVELASGN